MSYLNFGIKNINSRNTDGVIENYNDGYIFGRTELGYMTRVRSFRVNLKNFSESSENRRILRKYEHQIKLNEIPYKNYSWEIHKLGKDFYDTKFGKDTFSANKIKELFTSTGTNFNTIITFTNPETNEVDGYCIAVIAEGKQRIIHYAYPFYKLELINSSFGMYMMTRTVQFFKQKDFDYIYLGSVHEPASLYKLQFEGAEWWNEEMSKWDSHLQELKDRVRNS